MNWRLFRTGTLIFSLGVLILVVIMGRSEKVTGPNLNRPTVDYFFDIYGKVRDTKPSGLKDNLEAIVRKRLACYDRQYFVGNRLKECQKDYLLDLVTVARTNIKSAPLLGKALPGFKLCPIVYAMCQGEESKSGEEDCVVMEVKAIEYVLDQYWRGATVLREPGEEDL